MYGIHDVALSPLEESVINLAIVSAIVVALIKGERKLEDRNTFAMLSLLAIFGAVSYTHLTLPTICSV